MIRGDLDIIEKTKNLPRLFVAEILYAHEDNFTRRVSSRNKR